MKICLLSYRANPYCGGQGIYVKNVCREMVCHGHEVHVIMGPPYVDLPEQVTSYIVHNNRYCSRHGLQIIDPERPFSIFHPLNFYEYLISRLGSFPEILSFSLRIVKLLKRLNKKEGFDIIFDNQGLGYGMLLVKRLGVPIVTMIHHPLSIDKSSLFNAVTSFKKKCRALLFYPVAMQSVVSRSLGHLVTVSAASADAVSSAFGIGREKIAVLYNGIDTGVFFKKKETRKVKGRIIFVGNTEDPNKGFHLLLRALQYIKTKTISVTVVDGGAYHKRLTRQLFDLLSLDADIVYTGKISTERLVEQLNISQLAVVPSFFEGFGLPAAEAMACGVPVIVTDSGALPEVVGKAGCIIRQGDYMALARSIDRLLNDEVLLDKMGRLGIDRVRELFTWKKHVEGLSNVFNNVLQHYT